VTITPAGPVVIVPEEIPFEVIYESKDLIVIDKPAGFDCLSWSWPYQSYIGQRAA